MKKFFLLLLLPYLLWSEPSHAEKESLVVFIFAGQSNMVGKRSKAAELPKDYQGEQAKVLIFTDGKWERYRPGLDQPSGFGPEVSAALELAKTTGKPIGIIKHAVGGTNLAHQWNPAAEKSLYATLKKKVKAATEEQYLLKIEGAFWMQGGADARSDEMANAYPANLDALIAAMRRDFKNPALSFVAGRSGRENAPPHPRYPHLATVRAAQMQPRESYTSIDCSDISLGPDNIHYDTPGIAKLGRRMATAMTTLLEKETQ
jgi:hypothetical protein